MSTNISPLLPANLFGKPVLRTEDNETQDHRKASWLDLFFDLFFVAAIRVISHEFAHDLGHRSRGILVQTILYIVAIRRLWSSITYFFERYKTQGMTKRLFMFVQMFLIAGITLTMLGGVEEMQTFFLLYGIAKGGLAAMYIWTNTGHDDPLYCKNNRLQIYGNSSVLIASLIALFLPGERTAWIVILALLFDVFIPILGRSTLKYLAPSFETETYRERFGLFIIIVLGESILGAISGVERANLTSTTISLIISAVLLSFAHWWIYFEYIGQAEIIKKHILPRTYFHLPLTIGFTLISAVILYIVNHSSQATYTPVALLIICCILIMLTVMGFEKITGPYSRIIPQNYRYKWHMLVSIAIMLLFIPNRGLPIRVPIWGITIAALVPIILRAYSLATAYKQQKLAQNPTHSKKQ